MFRKKKPGCLVRILLLVLIVTAVIFVVKNWNSVLAYAGTLSGKDAGDYQLTWGAPQLPAGAPSLPLPENGTHSGTLALVSAEHPLPQDYVPAGIINVYEKRQKGLLGLAGSDIELNQDTLHAMETMLSSARADHVDGFILTSGYRSIQKQTEIYDERLQSHLSAGSSPEEAEAITRSGVNPPGASEHHLGLAADLTVLGSKPDKNGHNDAFALTLQGRWIQKNAWRHGFILRYTRGKEKITGVRAEPWHVRYVGIPHAEVMQREDLCLEEYIELLRKKGGLSITTWEGEKYHVFYAEEKDEKLTVPQGTAVSGDGLGGYILTLRLP